MSQYYQTFPRQQVVTRDAGTAATPATVAAASAALPQCEGWGTDLSDKGLRIASVFIILVGSLLGVFLPMALARTSPNWRFSQLAFFLCKYFGSGVILSTAFMHLLSPAVEALSDPCLGDALPSYDWGHAICLMTIMVMFYIELMAARFNFSFGHGHDGPPALPPQAAKVGGGDKSAGSSSLVVAPAAGNNNINGNGPTTVAPTNPAMANSSAVATATRSNSFRLRDVEMAASSSGGGGSGDDQAKTLTPLTQSKSETSTGDGNNGGEGASRSVLTVIPSTSQNSQNSQHHQRDPHTGGLPTRLSYPPGHEDVHLAHDREHVHGDSHASYSSQIVSLLILEFGVVFHSLFIGLSLAGSDNLKVLLIVIAFHQFFEGLGLGSRLAVAVWPSHWQAWTGYLMALGYGVTTPLGIAIGLGVNAGLASHPSRSQLVNGVFDAVSAGILIYTALVELLAHEFMFNPEMRDAQLRVQMLAFACVAVGVAVMSVLAKWA
ncbi:plasma membrane low affinity zinc ion transporter [Niveomyces insectorum RCEF 264]|uniref:Plasma membrane low affinity zinc ion transporter n=1 Tax=Niveomyces insectorum RCEF 264 TaxID=1081102 RepID=A0A167WAB0_9HYPO|nr:plasma membrane low affinity zinc ion transporter [Niveomyces insectorum RCEF 264]